MPFEGIDRLEETETPFNKMADKRRLEAIENAQDAELVQEEDEELSEDGSLNLEKITHLEIFLESAEGVYMDAVQYEAQAMAENYKALDIIMPDGEEVPGDEVFSTLYDKLQEFQIKLDGIRYTDATPENGYSKNDVVPITLGDVEELQVLYDEMILLRNNIFSAYRNAVGPVVMEVLEPEEPEASRAVPGSTIQSPGWTHTIEDYQDVTDAEEVSSEVDEGLESHRTEVEAELRIFLEENGAQRIDRRIAKSVGAAQTVAELDQIKNNILTSPEFVRVDAGFEAKLSELRNDITEEALGVKENLELMTERFPEVQRTEDVQSILDILTAFEKRAAVIQSRAQELDEQDTSVLERTLQTYLRKIQSISKETERFIENLSNAEAGMPELDEQKESESDLAAKTEDESLISPEPAEVEQPEVLQEELLDTESSPEVVVPVEMAPVEEKLDEVEDIVSLQKRAKEAQDNAYQNMFLSAPELETVKAFGRQIERQIADKASEQKILVTVESLESLVQDYTAVPAADYIAQRMEKVLRHVDEGPGNTSEEKRTAHAMAEVVQRLLDERTAGKDISDERISQAYLNLESFVNDNEAAWLSVCGMRVPAAGAGGVFGARSFREGLMVARDRHPELRRSLDKQLFVDDIVRMLQTVPASGLTQEQVDKISRLAREIDISTRIVEAKQAEAAAAPQKESVLKAPRSPFSNAVTTPSVNIETAKSKETLAKKMRAKLAVTSEDAPEASSVEIDVAKLAETSIAEAETEPRGLFNAIKTPTMQPVVAAMEEVDPVNVAVPEAVPEILRPEKIDENSLTRKYLNSSEYSQFIDEYYTSPEAYEKTLKIEIDSIDSEKTDKVAEYYGEKRASAFGWLKDMNLSNIEEFLGKTHEEKRELLQQQNVSYESISVWIDLLGPMKTAVGENPDMRFGELFARWMIETEMTYFQDGTSASQFTL